MPENQYPSAPASNTTRALIAACAMLGSAVSALAVAPLYQWSFDSADGANTGTGTGGTLALNVGLVTGGNGYAAGSFGVPGVSGRAGDKAFNAQNSYDNYHEGTSSSRITNAAAVSSLDLTGLTQFTITMWVKRSGFKAVDLLNIGEPSHPGISIGLDGNWGNGILFGINGHVVNTGDLWGAGYNTDWVFLAIAYNGTNTVGGACNNDALMKGIYGTTGNASVITGGTGAAPVVATGLGVHDGTYWVPSGAPVVGATDTLFLANRGTNTDGTANGFDGQMDDIRIYKGLLTLSEIEAIRASAIPAPPVSVSAPAPVSVSACASASTSTCASVPSSVAVGRAPLPLRLHHRN